VIPEEGIPVIRTHFAILAVIVLAAAAASAQPSAGDYVVVHAASPAGPTLLFVDRTGTAATLVVAPANHLVVEPRMDVGNHDLVATFNHRSSSAGSLVRITPGGQVATLATASSVVFPRAIEVDDDGTYLLLGSLDVLQRSARGRFFSIGSVPPPFGGFAMTIDPITGYYWMAGFGGKLAYMHHRTNVVTTLLPAGFRYITGMDHDEATDTFAFCNETLQSIFFVDRQFRIVSSFATPGQNWSLRLSPETGHVHVLDGSSTVTERTQKGVVVRTTRLAVRVDFFSLEVYGSRPISGVGSAARGTVYQLRIGFPAAGGLTYAAALSLGGIRPGIGLPDGRRIALAIDPLFLLTAAHGDIPGLTQGLRGTLSAAGQATATIAVPTGLPIGLRVFASAVVIDARAPVGLRTGNTWAFEVR
jgi:hypothetical protein